MHSCKNPSSLKCSIFIPFLVPPICMKITATVCLLYVIDLGNDFRSLAVRFNNSQEYVISTFPRLLFSSLPTPRPHSFSRARAGGSLFLNLFCKPVLFWRQTAFGIPGAHKTFSFFELIRLFCCRYRLS